MLTVIDVIRALSELIEVQYPQFKLVDYDVDEGFEKPAFFIEPEDINASWVASDYLKESSNLNIVFFAEDRYGGLIDLLDMKNKLTVVFDDPLYITDGKTEYYASLITTTSDIYKSDKVLTFNIQVDLIQKVERKETKPYMEELNTNIN